MSSFFFNISSPGEDEPSSCASFSATPSESLSYTFFTPGSYRAQPLYYTVASEWFHLEQLGIKHVPQEPLTGRKWRKKAPSLLLIPRFSPSPEGDQWSSFHKSVFPLSKLSAITTLVSHIEMLTANQVLILGNNAKMEGDLQKFFNLGIIFLRANCGFVWNSDLKYKYF